VPSPNSHSKGHPGIRGKSANHQSSTSGNGPNAHATFGLCTAATASAGHPNTNATVFPSAETCSTVEHPGPPADADNHGSGKPADPGAQGADHKPATTPNGPPSSTPAHGAVTTPNGGGTSTADTAGTGHSSTGTGTANQHASAGSDNAGAHRP
jgi:hypothetical protein